jgi:hypothetical protein
MTASTGWGEESRKTPRSEPLPADPTGQRLCEIFGHYPWNFIRADLPDDATTKAAWTTVTTYPLRPSVLWNHWQDANQLIGVRFTHDTRYALLDLDAGGDYCTPEGVAQIRAALETIGITRTLLIRSSWSGGLHLYIPFAEWVNTFNLAVALKECLKAQGFRLKAGQLEIFPNVKAYGVQTFIEYMGHRLPLQPGSGSCLLDDALNPIGSSLARFFWLWDGAAGHQDMDTLRHAMKIGRDNHRKSPSAAATPSTAGGRISTSRSPKAGLPTARPTTCSKPSPAMAASSKPPGPGPNRLHPTHCSHPPRLRAVLPPPARHRAQSYRLG